MAAKPSPAGVDEASLEPWRRFFNGVDVFNVLAHAILVAATDMPQEFRRRRDSIIEEIFRASAVVPTLGRAASEGLGTTNHVSTENGGNDVMATRSCKGGPPQRGNEEKEMAAAERLATASDQHVHGQGGDNNNAGGACAGLGSDWLHMIAEEMDQAMLETEEVIRIKAILVDHHEQSVDVLFDSLRKLQLMQLTVDKLKSTDIEVAVAALGKHKSHKIRTLVQDIAKDWKVVVDEWVAATTVGMEGDSNKSLDKTNSSAAEDEGGLAIPPMDVGALFVSQATAIQHVSEFLGDMDDGDGILNNHITTMDKDGGSGRQRKCKGTRPSNTAAGMKQPIIVLGLSATQESGRRCRRVVIKYKPSSTEGGQKNLSKRTSGTLEKTTHKDKKPRQNRGEVTVRGNPSIAAARKALFGRVTKTGTLAQSLEGPKFGLGNMTIHLADMGLDRTKRRLREAYEEAENAKRRRRIQVVEPHDIPELMGRKPVMKSRHPSRRTLEQRITAAKDQT